jgi:pyrimidine operon attenuation protein/uracil phosphoribosyltransferase
MIKDRTLVLDSSQIDRKIARMAHQIYENNYKESSIIIVGVEKNGVIISKKISSLLKKISPLEISHYAIRLEKDKPLNSEPEFTGDLKDIKDQVVVLVDDVLNSGRTLIYATKFLLDSQPRKLITATLVDRFHRRFPIRADYVGLTLSTNLKEHIAVELDKGKEAVYLE